jgi:L-lactate dehydrogenase complex protein LldG
MVSQKQKKMSSREKILAAIAYNKPALTPVSGIKLQGIQEADLLEKFTATAIGIGSKVFKVDDFNSIEKILLQHFKKPVRMISNVKELAHLSDGTNLERSSPHSFADVDLTILSSSLAVAENSALWLTEDCLGQRVVPFITQHLALIIRKESIVPTMHEAYEQIGLKEYGYGVFIAGPSKTADIEQSLVLGAHGPRSLWIFVM